MYVMDGAKKRDPERRWRLPDRILFGHGACAILAGVYLHSPPLPGFFAERIIPDEGYWGNHIYVTNGHLAFDYHGYSLRKRLLAHHRKVFVAQSDAAWNCRIERVDFPLLSTEELNARKMLGPDQYSGDILTRAQRFIDRIEHASASKRAAARG